MQKIKILICELLVCCAVGGFIGSYALIIWGKRDVSRKVIKIYQGQWIEDIRKAGDYWSVGYVEVIK